MDRSTAFELPVELLERVFSIGWPMLDAEERLRCQLVCKTWQQALDPRRWPLQWLELKVEACQDGKPAAPPAALWVQRVRPGVRQLRITIGSEGGHLRGRQPLSFDSPAVRAVHSALLALHPADALHALSLSAPFLVLECFVQDLGRFTGLQQLQLLSVDFPPASELLDQQVARALAAAGATQITYLECNNLACLPHLAAWPNLQSLALLHVRPTSVTSEQLALLAAAPGLRRLAFSYHMRLGARDYSRVCSQETDRLKEVYRALPSCAVIEY
ncbi:F-box domain-containing [Chlorella sorokiniana]|uniref:F-box domain-containing n=1 Tax=Chlorella sorokiniana TaxID=3076 RepID=A0A2P6TGD2_CHLSO|nr:F-box domain-containing [Chlorella sorokiniana]|eukprot:PRW33187.1 F-box domain-containing [Chlorella sorokiniana]